jgi:hypothetical protein
MKVSITESITFNIQNSELSSCYSNLTIYLPLTSPGQLTLKGKGIKTYTHVGITGKCELTHFPILRYVKMVTFER